MKNKLLVIYGSYFVYVSLFIFLVSKPGLAVIQWLPEAARVPFSLFSSVFVPVALPYWALFFSDRVFWWRLGFADFSQDTSLSVTIPPTHGAHLEPTVWFNLFFIANMMLIFSFFVLLHVIVAGRKKRAE
ncbi:MAG: hypothetical protein AAB388_01395 [Patescibacteria group bacterium]